MDRGGSDVFVRGAVRARGRGMLADVGCHRIDSSSVAQHVCRCRCRYALPVVSWAGALC